LINILIISLIGTHIFLLPVAANIFLQLK